MKKFPVPTWFLSTSVYQINPRTFSKEGTLKAIEKELPLLSKLGFGVVYLCPLFESDDSTDQRFWSIRQKKSETLNPKNPYRMNDYFFIDEEYGTMEDLRELVAAAHALSMRVILDLVFLHIGPNARVLKAHPEFIKRTPEGDPITTYWNFPYLNFESEGLREYLWSNMTYYVGALDVDGFRCDVADQVPLDFWEEGKRRILKIKSDAILINEGDKDEYLSVFDSNYGWHWHEAIYKLLTEEVTAEVLRENYLSTHKDPPQDGFILRDMDNHDTVTDWPYRIEEHFGHSCMELILALNYTVDGVPMVYSGNELADTAKLSMFANRFYPGKFEMTDRNKTGAEVDRRKQVITLLNSFKKVFPVLQTGKTVWERQAGKCVKFERVLAKERITFIGNFGTEIVEAEINGKEILLSNEARVQNDIVRLPLYGYVILKDSI